MGMFDTICADVLGDTVFQTKDLDCLLDHYRIDQKDNRLYRRKGDYINPEWVLVDRPPSDNILMFYTYENGFIREYCARFDGSIVCERIDQWKGSAAGSWKKVWKRRG